MEQLNENPFESETLSELNKNSKKTMEEKEKEKENVSHVQINNNPQEGKPLITTKPDKSKNEIVDVISQYQKGNFDPFLYCLKKKYNNEAFLDKSGYGALHHATSYRKFDIVRILIEIFDFDPNQLSATQQTCLMISSNFGFLEIIKYFAERDVNINLIDSCHFNALLYTVKVHHHCF